MDIPHWSSVRLAGRQFEAHDKRSVLKESVSPHLPQTVGLYLAARLYMDVLYIII